MNLDRGGADLFRGFGRKKLRHRGCLQARLAGIAQGGSPQHHQLGRLQGSGHIGEAEGDRLMLDDRLAESFTFFRVSQSAIIGGTRHADRLRGYADPPAFQIRERNLEPLPFFAEHLLGKQFAVLGGDLAVVRATLAHGVLDTRHPVTGRMGRHNKRGDALLSGVRIGHRKYYRKVSTLARRDELLGSNEHERVAAVPGARLDRCSIGARVWLGQAECPQQLPGCQRTQVASLLILVAVVKQGEANQRVVHLECCRDRTVGGGDFRHRQRI